MIRALVRLPDSLAVLSEALAAAGVADGGSGDGLLFGPADDEPKTWAEAREQLATSFRLTRSTVETGAPVLYLVSQPALLGARGPVPAMLAGALVSGMRALAMEGRRDGVRANALTYDDRTDPDHLARWARTLLELPGLSGDVVDLGHGHHGKVRQ